MTQNEKDLLLKDLCARLPYGLKAKVYSYWNEDYVDDYIVGIDIENDDALCGTIPGQRCEITLIKPYLFPLSSMTEEQKKDLLLTTVGEKGLKLFSVTKDGIISNDKEEQSFANFSINWINFSNKNVKAYIGWLIKNHFDIHDLIPMGFAVDATGKNIYER